MSFYDGVFSFNEPNDQRSVKVNRKPESNQVASGVFYNWPGDWRPVLSEELDRKWPGRDNVFRGSDWGRAVFSIVLILANHYTSVSKKRVCSARSVHLCDHILIPNQSSLALEEAISKWSVTISSSWFYSLVFRAKEVLLKG